MIVILGTAHSKSTLGKRSPDGKFREYLFSRQVCKLIQKELISRGIQCFIDIEGDEEVSLSNRCSIVNKYCTKYGTNNCTYVSIHANAAGNGKSWMNAKGWAAYTSKGITKADTLSSCLYRAADRNFTGRKIRRDGSKVYDWDWEENFYVLVHTKCAAVLTENFFQDNKDDVDFLMSEEGINSIVKTHVEGILEYINS